MMSVEATTGSGGGDGGDDGDFRLFRVPCNSHVQGLDHHCAVR